MITNVGDWKIYDIDDIIRFNSEVWVDPSSMANIMSFAKMSD